MKNRKRPALLIRERGPLPLYSILSEVLLLLVVFRHLSATLAHLFASCLVFHLHLIQFGALVRREDGQQLGAHVFG